MSGTSIVTQSVHFVEGKGARVDEMKLTEQPEMGQTGRGVLQREGGSVQSFRSVRRAMGNDG